MTNLLPLYLETNYSDDPTLLIARYVTFTRKVSKELLTSACLKN